MAPTAQTGAVAVSESRISRERQDAVVVEDIVVTASAGATMQRAGTKTFYLREGVWTDAELTDATRLPETAVTFGSEEYFALIQRVPALAPFLALGEQVAVIHDGRVYRVRAAGS